MCFCFALIEAFLLLTILREELRRFLSQRFLLWRCACGILNVFIFIRPGQNVFILIKLLVIMVKLHCVVCIGPVFPKRFCLLAQ